MPFETELDELRKRTEHALAMGGPEKLAKRRAKGLLNARERLDALLDADTFIKSGMHARSFRKEVAERTPADGKVAGYGRIDGREVAVVSNDFTVLGASSSAINGKKFATSARSRRNAACPSSFSASPQAPGYPTAWARQDAPFWGRIRQNTGAVAKRRGSRPCSATVTAPPPGTPACPISP